MVLRKLATLLPPWGPEGTRILVGPQTLFSHSQRGLLPSTPVPGAVTQGAFSEGTLLCCHAILGGSWQEILMDLLLCKHLCRASILFMFAFVYAKLMVSTPLR